MEVLDLKNEVVTLKKVKSKPLITLKEYLEIKGKNKIFLIPSYQRGYIWGKSRGAEKNSVEYLMESIINHFPDKPLFLQGVTVSETDSYIELIDGQQRTTILFLLLQYLGYTGNFEIDYLVRTESSEFLKNLQGKSTSEIVDLCKENDLEEFQDIYYFKKSIQIIHNKLKDYDKTELLNFLIGNTVNNGLINFLYIVIPPEKATTVFAMMNGNKAVMNTAEIIKAEMLRLVSFPKNSTIANNYYSSDQFSEAMRWDQNLIRSKYAREWDKWLYWWNRKDVKSYYQTNAIMGLLIETFMSAKHPKALNNFENFRDLFLRGKSIKDNTKKAMDVFYELRHLQKRFEDVFNSYDEVDESKRLHNDVGAIMILLKGDDRKHFIQKYFGQNVNYNISEFVKLVYLGLSLNEIEMGLGIQPPSQHFDLKTSKLELIDDLEDDLLYHNKYETGSRQLLRRNLQEDTKLKRKFDFEVWKNRSLEHVYAKSKVYHIIDNCEYRTGDDNQIDFSKIDHTYINRADFQNNGSEHCIGNLTLLYQNENSKFSNSPFDDKKEIYFNLIDEPFIHSRHLIHTISIFSKKSWGVKDIQENKANFINEVKSYYGI